MVNNKIDPVEVVRILNELLKLDREAITSLVKHRVKCNDALADHPTVQVLSEQNENSVGLLGILNGLCGIHEDNGYGYLGAIYNSNGELLNFENRFLNKKE